MFGRATIRLGIGPHSSCFCFCYHLLLNKDLYNWVTDRNMSTFDQGLPLHLPLKIGQKVSLATQFVCAEFGSSRFTFVEIRMLCALCTAESVVF